MHVSDSESVNMHTDIRICLFRQSFIPPFHRMATARMAIMAILLKIRHRSKSTGICKTLRLLRFHNASSTLPIRSCYANHDASTVQLRSCHAGRPPMTLLLRCYYGQGFQASYTLTKMQLRSHYDLSDGAALMLCL